MEKGDISNQPAQRMVFVWEGLLAHLDLVDVKAHNRAMKRGKWDRAAGMWDESVSFRHLLKDILYRRELMVDVLSITGIQQFSDALAVRLVDDGYPFGRLITSTVAEYTAELAYSPEVHSVFHGDTAAPFLFGSRGRAVATPLDVRL